MIPKASLILTSVTALLMALANGVARGEFREERLYVGESKILSFESELEIHANRKGIIDLYWLEGPRWRLTAIKPGVVIVKGFDASHNEKLRIVVHVEKNQQKPVASDRVFGQESMICEHQGIRCDSKSRTITGRTSSWHWYFNAQQLCQAAKDCHFDVILTNSGLESLQQTVVRVIGNDSRVNLLDSRQVLIQIPCKDGRSDAIDVKTLDDLTQQGITKRQVLLRCPKKSSRFFQLNAKIFYLKDEDQEQLGVDWQQFTKFDPDEVRAFWGKFHNQILSDPAIEIRLGQQVEVRSGGEIKVISQSDKPEEHWRPVGSILTIKVDRSEEAEALGEFRVDYELRVSLSQSAASGRLSSSLMKSQTFVALNQGKIVGQIDSRHLREGEAGVPVLSSIPIISPLFKYDEDYSQRTKVYLWLELKEL